MAGTGSRWMCRIVFVALATLGFGEEPAEGALVAHWPFNETTGTVADDAVGTNDGTLVGFPGDNSQWQPGKIGNALLFDGVNDHVVHSFNLPRAQGTIAHWLKPAVTGKMISVYESDFPGAGATYDGLGDNGTLLEIHSGADTGAPPDWQARYQAGSGAGDNNAAGFGRFKVSAGEVVPGAWTHVAMTWNTSGDLVLYVNCQEIGRQSMAAGTFANLTTSQRFIGRPSAATRFWNGLIDDVRIYDTALSQPEIEAAAQFCPQQAPIAVPTLSRLGVGLLVLAIAAAGLWWLGRARVVAHNE